MSDEFSETRRQSDDGSEGGQPAGSEGDASKDKLPLQPSEDDDTALGDTDQHSDADA